MSLNIPYGDSWATNQYATWLSLCILILKYKYLTSANFSFSFIAKTQPQYLRQQTSGRLRGPNFFIARRIKMAQVSHGEIFCRHTRASYQTLQGFIICSRLNRISQQKVQPMKSLDIILKCYCSVLYFQFLFIQNLVILQRVPFWIGYRYKNTFLYFFCSYRQAAAINQKMAAGKVYLKIVLGSDQLKKSWVKKTQLMG